MCGDAFSQEVKEQVLDIIRENLGEVDFFRHHGFGMPGVEYSRDVEPDIF
ncbi:MAG: hypothetical protein KAI21_10300 [Deltaproteobacteria bacterium]|nr:hypothetical protein [Deltaproteobacteria bacterium]